MSVSTTVKVLLADTSEEASCNNNVQTALYYFAIVFHLTVGAEWCSGEGEGFSFLMFSMCSHSIRTLNGLS